MNIRLRFLALAALLLVAATARAESVRADHIEAELIAENTALKPGENWVAMRLKPEQGWHTYWKNPGDTGIPTQLTWTLPKDVTAGAIRWPYPQLHKLGDLGYFGYGEETLHLVPITLPASWPTTRPVDLKAEAKWLVCADVCIPGKAELSLILPVAPSPVADSRWTSRFAEARSRLPIAAPWKAQFSTGDGDFSLRVEGAKFDAAQVAFFPYASDLLNHAAAQRLAFDPDGLRLSQKLSPYFVGAPASAEGVLVIEQAGKTLAYELTAQPGMVAAVKSEAAVSGPPAAARTTLPLVLLFAVIGGLILNLMPCVFPVLSLKALSVMQNRGHAAHRQRGHALAYAAGVILSCGAVAVALLTLRAGGEAIGWGFQLQSPIFVGVLAYLLFALGLSMSGAVELGTSLMGLGQSLTQGRGYASSFFTGVLATVVASPCTAPFMGTALGYALTQPPLLSLSVFLALGLGLSLPFLLLGFFPRLAGFLPRPGAWMETFKQLMAYPLYLSVVWLVWVLAHQTSVDGAGVVLVGLVLIAFALWLWNRRGWLPKLLQYGALAAAVLLLAHPLLRQPAVKTAQATAAGHVEAYSESRLGQLRAQGRTVFVDFTADWCITCKVNEHAVLDAQRVQESFSARNVATLVGDWTRSDPAITAVLEKFGRSGVPLYLVYVNGGEPKMLPQILTPDTVISALNP
jgi:thiol:disulfide interchange protein DsbD